MGTRALFPFTLLFLFAFGGLHFRSLQACILIVVRARRREHSAFEILSHHFAFFIDTIPLCYSLLCLLCVCLSTSPSLSFPGVIRHSTSLSKSRRVLRGLAFLLNPLFHRDSPLHPPALLNASSCVNRKLIGLTCFFLLFYSFHLQLLVLFIPGTQDGVLRGLI